MFLLSFANYVHKKNSDSSLYLKFITEKGKEIKPQNGYRQLGLIGSFVSTHSYRDCKPPKTCGCSDVDECLNANDKVSQQNYIQLATKVHQLTKR